MRRHCMVTVVTLGLSWAPGCKKSEPEEKPAPAQEAAKPAEPAPPEQAPEPIEETGADGGPKTQVTDGIPTEEDYEEEALEVITADNLEAQLDKLEAEIRTN